MCHSHTPPPAGVTGLLLTFAVLVACTRGESALHNKVNAVHRGSTTLAEASFLEDEPPAQRDFRLRGNIHDDVLYHFQPGSRDILGLEPNIVVPFHDDDDDDEHDHDDDEHDHDHDHDHHHEVTWQRALHVIAAAVAISLVSGLGICLPNVLAHLGAKGSSTTRALVETLCTAFAAGGFWGLALIHMLLEAVTALQGEGVGFYLGDARNFFNAAYILAAAGYIIMLGVQNFAVVLNAKAHKSHVDHHLDHSSNQSDKVALMDAAVSTLALTFHAFFEGLVCGMRDDATLIWVAAVSVMGHKWAESFSLAQRMRSSGISHRNRVIFLSIFLLASPVGALVGLPLSALDNHATVGILNSLSAGILIFVAGHCTEDVFGGHCHSHNLVMTCEHTDTASKYTTRKDTTHTDKEVHDDSASTHKDFGGTQHNHDKTCPGNHPVYVQAQAERETHTHGHGPSHCTEEPDFSASIPVFLGRMTACIAGTALVAGMMCVHMTNSAHSHAA